VIPTSIQFGLLTKIPGRQKKGWPRAQWFTVSCIGNPAKIGLKTRMDRLAKTVSSNTTLLTPFSNNVNGGIIKNRPQTLIRTNLAHRALTYWAPRGIPANRAFQLAMVGGGCSCQDTNLHPDQRACRWWPFFLCVNYGPLWSSMKPSVGWKTVSGGGSFPQDRQFLIPPRSGLPPAPGWRTSAFPANLPCRFVPTVGGVLLDTRHRIDAQKMALPSTTFSLEHGRKA